MRGGTASQVICRIGWMKLDDRGCTVVLARGAEGRNWIPSSSSSRAVHSSVNDDIWAQIDR